jgi:cation diffusion facilitator family transporter
MAAEQNHGSPTIETVYAETRQAAKIGLAVTLSLGVGKLVGGWTGHSLALLSDSVHSLGDAASAASILLALKWAELPADREHPYGHTRIETIAASNVALLLVLSSFWIVWEAISTWQQASEPPHAFTVLIALAGVALNEGAYRYMIGVARRTGSKSVEVAAWDQRLDVIGSAIVLIGLIVSIWGGPGWHVVDHIAALFVAAVVFFAGATLFWGSIQELMDRQADPELLATVRSLAKEVPGVTDIEKLIVRKSGLECFVDIHVEVAGDISVREGHHIGHAVKAHLITNIAAVKDVLVHIEPAR